MEVLSQLAKWRPVSGSMCSSCLRRLNKTSPPGLGLQNSPRFFHTSRLLRENLEERGQAQPLGDFYTDLLSAPIPKASTADSSLPTFARSGDLSKEERAKKLFGDMHGSGYERKGSDTPNATWRTINGIPIPPRPAEPDNCCMSGCAHCVWDDYRDDVEHWAMRLHEAQAKLHGRGMKESPKIGLARQEVADASSSMDDDGGGSEALWDSPSVAGDEEDLFQAIPVGIREFMATEKRIRDRQKARKERKKAAK